MHLLITLFSSLNKNFQASFAPLNLTNIERGKNRKREEIRSVGSFNTPSTMTTTTTTTKATFSPPETAVVRSPWHSPLPYLFGGLAAMLGLITFALIILACTYWKHTGRSENGEEEGSGDTDLEKAGDSGKVLPVFEEKIFVIMAGNLKPTFLATPMSSSSSSSSCSRASLFGVDVKTKKEERDEAQVIEKPKQEMGHDDHTETATTIHGATESQENPENQV
ncbi:unnamed protein product [Camellia sinensis]